MFIFSHISAIYSSWPHNKCCSQGPLSDATTLYSTEWTDANSFVLFSEARYYPSARA